jgi:uncharacterized protein (DUF433 family)
MERQRAAKRPRTEVIGGERYQYNPLSAHIVRAKGVCGGRPTFKYTRIQIAGILGRIKAGEGFDSIVTGYQGKISREALSEALEIMKTLIQRIQKTRPQNGRAFSLRKRAFRQRLDAKKRRLTPKTGRLAA